MPTILCHKNQKKKKVTAQLYPQSIPTQKALAAIGSSLKIIPERALHRYVEQMSGWTNYLHWFKFTIWFQCREEAHFWKGYSGKYFGLRGTHYSSASRKPADTYTNRWAWWASKHRWPLVGTSELTLQAAGLIRWGRRPDSIYTLSKIEESFPCLWSSGPEQNWNAWDGYRTAQDSSQHLGCWAQEHHISGSSDSRTALGRGWWRWCTCFLLGHRLPALLIKAISRMAWETSESKQFVKPVKQNDRQPRPHPHPTPTSSSTTPPQRTH